VTPLLEDRPAEAAPAPARGRPAAKIPTSRDLVAIGSSLASDPLGVNEAHRPESGKARLALAIADDPLIGPLLRPVAPASAGA
jgi:hypothetical protein